MSHVQMIRPVPAAAKPTTADDLRGLIAILGVNLDAIRDALAQIESVRFSRGCTPEVREALADPVARLRDLSFVAEGWVNRGLSR